MVMLGLKGTIDKLAKANFTFNLRKFALFDQLSFSHYQISYFYVLCKEKLSVDN